MTNLAVGLLLAVKHEGENALVLQERPLTDSYPNACQVTAHGKLSR